MNRRRNVSSGSPYEPIAGFSRAVRIGNVVAVAGTAPIGPDGRTLGIGDPAAQARRCFEISRAELRELGADLGDVIRTRLLLTRIEDWRAVAEVHGEYFRDIFDHLVRINQSIDAARETVNTAIQVALAMVSVSDNEVTKRLAAYAALVAVPTMIAGVYGMNFEVMPELKWNFGYPLSIAMMAVLDAWLWWKFRKAGWI